MKRAVIVAGVVAALALGGAAQAATLGAWLVIHAPTNERRASIFVNPNPGPVIGIEVIDPQAVPATLLSAAERAVTAQINTQVRRHWPGPSAQFGAGSAIRVDVEPQDAISAVCEAQVGSCHTGDGTVHIATPSTIISGVTPSSDAFTLALSHDLIETLVDPTITVTQSSLLVEPCDPVVGDGYLLDGMLVSDFVYPRWFTAGSSGAWDWMRQTPGALRVDEAGSGYSPPAG